MAAALGTGPGLLSATRSIVRYQPRRGLLFLPESRRDHARRLSMWILPDVVRQIALHAGVPHTLRILRLADLARTPGTCMLSPGSLGIAALTPRLSVICIHLPEP